MDFSQLFQVRSILLTVIALALGSLIAIVWSQAKGQPDDDEWNFEDEKAVRSKGKKGQKGESSSKSSQQKSAKATAQKSVAPSKNQEQATADASAKATAAVNTSDVDASEGLQSGGDSAQEPSGADAPKKKKKKRRRKSAQNDNSDDDEDAEDEAGAEEDEEEEKKIGPGELALDEWTAAKPKKEKTAADLEAIEKEKKRAEKVADLRRRKAQINQQIRRLEEGLTGGSGGGNREDEERKKLEARSRLQDDLEKVNRSILRLTGHDIRDPLPPRSATRHDDDADDRQGDEDWTGDQQWEWDEWAAAEWSSWDASQDRGRGRRSRRSHGWEEEVGGFAGEDWQEQEWWDSSATASSGSIWVVKGSNEATTRRSRRADKAQQWSAWWEEASWEEGGDPSASSWTGAGADCWEGGDWSTPTSSAAQSPLATRSEEPRRRDRKGKGKGKSKDRDDRERRDQDDADDSRPSRKGKGKGRDREERDIDADEDLSESRSPKPKGGKGKDGKGKGKGKSKGKKGKDERIPEEDAEHMEDWLHKRLGDRPAAQRTADDDVSGGSDAAGADKAEEMRQAIAPLLARGKERIAWGDADSSDEDRPAAVARPGRSAHLTAALQKTSSPTREAGGSRSNGGGFDEDMVAFMGEEALRDRDKFDEQLKYVPKWVADKALRQRKQLFT